LIGGDFGWKHDPTCIVKVCRQGNGIYAQVLCYKTGMLNKDIFDTMENLNIHEDFMSVWDSANEKDITELQMMGVTADGAQKGPGSRAWGISKMQEFKLYVYQDDLSDLLFQELIMMVWQKDKSGNYKYNTLGQRIPSENEIKFNGYTIKDHAVDAVRYALSYYLAPYKKDDED
jgi:phage terminase large subunit